MLDASSPEVSVVIGALNRRQLLPALIDSVREDLRQTSAEIIVVDGGSDDGSLEWLVAQKDVITIVQHNRGEWEGRPVPRRSWGYFMNLGFRAASADAVCMLSDDCLVVPGAIGAGLRVLASDEDVGAVAFAWRNWPEQRRYWIGRTYGDTVFVNHGLYRAAALRDVGYADEETYSFYCGDGDLCLRMSEAGWRCVASTESLVEHMSHVGTSSGPAGRDEADMQAYADRWSRLGSPRQPWEYVTATDGSATAERYWGKMKPSPREVWRRRTNLWLGAVRPRSR